MDICLPVLKESNISRFDSNSVKNSVLNISHITFRDCRVHIFSDDLSRNSCIAECHDQHKSDRTFDDVEQSRQEGMCTLNITMGQERIPAVHQTQEHEKQSMHH